MEAVVPETFRSVLKNGLLSLLFRIVPAGSGYGVILLYHSVGTKAIRSVSPDRFARQMEWVRDHFDVRCLRAGFEDLRDGSRRPLVVTFDDGYRDNHEEAFPVLESLGLTATFFVSTNHVGGQMDTWNGPMSMMDRAQLRELARAGHEIGSHGRSHRRLTTLSDDELREETRTSRRRLEDWIGGSVSSFAYPHGDCDRRVVRAVARAGYERAVTTREKLMRPDGSDPYRLPRRIVHRTLRGGGFRAKTTPAFDWFQRLSCRG